MTIQTNGHSDHRVPTSPLPADSVGHKVDLQSPLRYHHLIIDLGDVLCFYSHEDIPSLPVPVFEMKNVLNSAAWRDYERGKVSTEQCIDALERDFGTKPGDISRSIDLMKQNVEWNEKLVDEVRKIKEQADGQLKVYLMTNISQPDFELLRPTIESWALFDDMFPSYAAGARKPNNAFYQHVLDKTNIQPSDAIFVDDKHDNVTSARVLGIQDILFDSTDRVLKHLSQLFESGERKAYRWLEANAKQMFGRTNNDIEIQDQFSQLVILALTGNRDLVCLSDATRKWNTFLGKPKLTSETFPDDLDTTSVALMASDIPEKTKHEVMDEMLTYLTPDGLFYTYFDRVRLRDCAFVNANVVRLFYYNDRGHEVATVIEYLTQYIASGAYRNGTRYYHRCDWALWLLADLCGQRPDAPELQRMAQLLREHLSDRMGCTPDPFSAALRFIGAQSLGLDNPRDLEIVLKTQESDGSWTMEPWIYNFGRSGILFGHVGMVTAMAWKALKVAGEEKIRKALVGF